MDAAQLAKLNGIRVYTIGVGTVGKAKSPVAIRPDGSYKYDWVDVRIDEEVLQGIASLTGARYSAPRMQTNSKTSMVKSTPWKKPNSTSFATSANRKRLEAGFCLP